MVEMELKASIENINEIKNELSRLGCEWGKLDEQVDKIYLRENTIGFSSPVIRLRRCKAGIFLTLKVLEENVNTAQELETRIYDMEVMDKILSILGFRFCVLVNKKRETTFYKGFSICLDDVEGGGTFIEIEKLSDNNMDQKNIYEQQKEILKKLGIDDKQLVNEKYYQIILNSKI